MYDDRVNSHTSFVIEKPEFVRLPKAGLRCPFTGLSRSALNELILPSAEQPNPPVRSVLMKKRGAIRGIRLIDYDSLMAYIRSFDESGDTIRKEVES